MSAPSVTPAGPPVAEVVARHRGRIVDVQHVRWAEPPAVAPAGYLTAGAVLVLLGLALAAFALAQAEAAGLCDAPPCPTPGASAGLGPLLIALGLVPLVLGLVRWRDRTRARYLVGEGPGVDLTVALPGAAASVPLVIALEQGLILSLPPGVRGRIDGPDPLDLGDAAAQGRTSIALPPGARADLELGALTFEIAHVAPADVPRSPLELDRLAWLSQLAAAALVGGAVLVLGSRPVEPLELDREAQIELVTRYIQPPPSDARPEPPPPPVERPAAAATRRASPPRAPERAPEPPPAPSVVIDEATGLVAPAAPTGLARRGKTGRTASTYDYDRVAGVLGDPAFIENVEEYTVSTQRGQIAYKVNSQVNAWWAEATGGPPRTSKHFGGLELAETERGGGVHSDKPPPKPSSKKVTVTAAAAAPIKGTSEEEARARRIVQVHIDPPTLTGDAGHDWRRLYESVRQKVRPWRQCYEDALDRDPKIGGVISFQLQFDADGKVTLARANWTTGTIGPIEPCLAAAARKWRIAPELPKPTTAVFQLRFESHGR